jgi:hypothetical protein
MVRIGEPGYRRRSERSSGGVPQGKPIIGRRLREGNRHRQPGYI